MTGLSKVIPIIIPAYEPDERLIELLRDFVQNDIRTVIVVDDGSGSEYQSIFEEAKKIMQPIDGCVLTHEVNKGKGRALKTAFEYVLTSYPEAIGVVSADSDGQHTFECIETVKEKLAQNQESLVMGVRNFDGEHIPWKSKFGNKLTMKVLGYITGIHVSDTQTGLRGIPRAFMEELLEVKGERFEFETRMLLQSVDRYPIREVSIKTIYRSKENHQTHFHPFIDSIRIYRILGVQFLKFMFTSLSSSLIDLILFAVFCFFLKPQFAFYVGLATVLARVISATYNYLMNYKVVFKSKEHLVKAAFKYIFLAILQMGSSAVLVSIGVMLLSFLPEVVTKAVVDTVLFFLSYTIQQRYVFRKK